MPSVVGLVDDLCKRKTANTHTRIQCKLIENAVAENLTHGS